MVGVGGVGLVGTEAGGMGRLARARVAKQKEKVAARKGIMAREG